MSKADRLAAKITEGIMFGHDHPNLQHELDRMNAAAHLRAIDASHQRLLEALEEAWKYAQPVIKREKRSPSNSQWMVEAYDRDEALILAAIKQAKELS